MPLVERAASIAMPPDAVFDFVADHRNALRWMHNFTRFEPVDHRVRGVGARVNATGLVMGMPISTTLEIVEFARPERLVSRTSGRLKSRSSWEFASEGTGTRVRFTGEYDLPTGLLRLVGGSLVQRELEKNAEMSLGNLKAELERVRP